MSFHLMNSRAGRLSWPTSDRYRNDEDTKCAYERSDDVYRVFRKMLESGHPPDNWNQLLAEARTEID